MSDRITESCDCGGSLQFTLEDLASERTVRCSRGCSVKLVDVDGGARQFNTEMRKLDRELSKLSRTIRFKF